MLAYLFSKRYSVPDYPYSILASSNVDSLNSLIKNILKEDTSKTNDEDLDSIEFDFYVNGNFLQGTLHELIKSVEEIKTVI